MAGKRKAKKRVLESDSDTSSTFESESFTDRNPYKKRSRRMSDADCPGPARLFKPIHRTHPANFFFLQDPPEFRPGHIVRFLPERCRIMIDPPELDFCGPAPEPIPRWNTIYAPVERVGMLVDTNPSCADDSVYMRPAASAPFYEYIDAENKIIVDGNFRFNSGFRAERDRLTQARDLMAEWQRDLQLELKDFSRRMRDWRVARRAWELDLVSREYERGNYAILCPGFSAKDLAAAKRHVSRENARDKNWEMDTCDVGLPGFTWGSTQGVGGNSGGILFAQAGEYQMKLAKGLKELGKETRQL
ncbi:hypothetical protein BJX96DRAFT_182245 [Aspergillus floccosus]